MTLNRSRFLIERKKKPLWPDTSLYHVPPASYAERAKIDGATLTIHAVTQKDSGEYRCEVTASQDHVSLGEAIVTLNVLGMVGNFA